MADVPGVLEMLMEASHFLVPDAIPSLVERCARLMGADSAVIHLVDLDQRVLVALEPERPDPEALMIDGTLAGRSFRQIEVVEVTADNGSLVQWVPMLDGTERLGVLQLRFSSGPAAPDLSEVRAFASAVTELIMSKWAYGDFFEVARRREPVTVGADLLWQLLPPLTFGTDELVIAAAFLPTARLGGDAFDYGVDATEAKVAIFDAVGHDLGAGLIATTAVAAYRNSRRSALGLRDTARKIGTEIESHFGDSTFATGILASVELGTGLLSWCVAGHPPPLLLRHGRVIKTLDPGRGMPFGVGPASEVFSESLEPGDRVLLYTDGVSEARDERGEFFGLEKLADLVGRTASGDPPPETMRRLMHAISDHSAGPLRDDATAVMIEWRGPGPALLAV